jgi:hypothetical protein
MRAMKEYLRAITKSAEFSVNLRVTLYKSGKINQNVILSELSFEEEMRF